MEKIIDISVSEDRIIHVQCQEFSLDIYPEKRKITAQQIFDLINYSKGDVYSVKCSNEYNKDPNVVNLLKEMLETIAGGINELSQDFMQ